MTRGKEETHSFPDAASVSLEKVTSGSCSPFREENKVTDILPLAASVCPTRLCSCIKLTGSSVALQTRAVPPVSAGDQVGTRRYRLGFGISQPCLARASLDGLARILVHASMRRHTYPRIRPIQAIISVIMVSV